MHRAAVCSELKKKLQIKDVPSITSDDLEDTQVNINGKYDGADVNDRKNSTHFRCFSGKRLLLIIYHMFF